MHSLYNFVSGPLAWLAFIVFIGGSIYRLVNLIILVHKKEQFIYSYMSLKYGLRSILRYDCRASCAISSRSFRRI